MLILFYLVLLCSNFLFIKSEDNGNITIDVKLGTNSCATNFPEYTLIGGLNVTLIVKPEMYINQGWWRLNNSAGYKDIYDKLKTVKKSSNTFSYTHLVDKSMEGVWEFTFHHHEGITELKQPKIQDGNHSFTESVCRTKVRVVPPEPTADHDYKFIIIAFTVGAIALIVIIAQSAYIIFLKAKARKLITLNTHNNLSKKMDLAPNDTARYCSNPGQRMVKAATPADDNNRESVIYEAPNIEIPSNHLPIPPPQLPAIATMPRAPRTDNNMKIDPQSMLASALNSPARSAMPENLPPTFPRPHHMEREINVANRPPLPLPPQGFPQNNMFQEVYEEMDAVDDNTYEPPPVINTMPPRLPMPPKKVPTGNLLNVRENTLKSRPINKPSVTPKPQRSASSSVPKSNAAHIMQSEQTARRINNANAQKNELEEALKRRKNVMPVPITSIPDPSSKASQRSRPLPASKARGPPPVHPVQEEIYYNENQASSDEEWTYEPLKPLNSYDSNIYNI